MTGNKSIKLEFTTKQAAAATLVIGLVAGGFAGFTAGTMAAAPTGAPADGNKDGQRAQKASDSQTSEEVFRQISNDLGLDTSQVMQCYQNSSNSEAWEDKRKAVQNLGNFGTPTFFVGNRDKGFVRITGAQPLSSFEQAFKKVRSDDPGNLTSLEGIELEGEPSKGRENASIKVVEYNEFGCPFCSEWNGFDASGRTPIDRMKIADSLERQYIDTGKVELIVKDYPVPQLHPNGPKAHRAANCVFKHERDGYFDFHDELFKRRERWMQG
ncbi:MAG: thioredoxin domain-containing protein [Candidatus Nanohalobium sp.]